MSQKEALIQKLEAKMDAWKADADKLAAKAREADADARLEIESHMDKLKMMRQAAEDRLTKLRHAGNGAWHDLREGAEKAFDDMNDAMRNALAQFH